MLLPSEKIVNEIFKHEEYFSNIGFEPTLTMALKTARTVFCYGFDSDLLSTHGCEAIKQHLIDAEWMVIQCIYITVQAINEN